MEIRDLQAELVPLFEPSQVVDTRFTAPPLYPLELITSIQSQNQRKKTDENTRKNRKQSILLSQGTRKSNNDKEMFQGNSEAKTDQENDESFGSEFRPLTKFWRENFQTSGTTNYPEKEREIFDKVNDQGLKNIVYRNNNVKVMDQTKGSGNQRYEQRDKLFSPKKGTRPILSMREAKDDSDDSDLLMNLKSSYSDMLTPKSSISSGSARFTERVSESMEQEQAEYQSLSPNCILGTTIGNQPWNSLNTNAQSEKNWAPVYQ
ncbi:unnamed protein product, partial [Wuchereria bancrofti]